MSASSGLRVHHRELARIFSVVEEAIAYYERFRSDFPAVSTERNYDLTILADILTDYYTAVETAFENTREERRWHKSLLGPMRIEVLA